MAGPLEGLTVVELGNWVQGPLAAQLLAHQGASVIKVERPERGDASRGLRSLYGAKMVTEDGRALLWELCNRNKESICLDLRQESGQAIMHELVRQADVFVTNLQRDSLETFRCTSDELFAVNDQLVYALGGGLTTKGPLSDAPAQDTVAMAHSGFMLTAGGADGTPAYPPGAIADVLAATSLASGVVSALLSRFRHGDGKHLVTTSLVRAAAWAQMLGIGVPANTGERLHPFERGKAANPLMSVYEAGDGRWIALGMVSMNGTTWRTFCEAVGMNEWFETTDWGDSYETRSRAAPDIAAAIQQLLLTKPAAAWLDALRRHELPCAMVNHPAELVLDEGIRADRLLAKGADGITFVTGPYAMDAAELADGAAPALGQHSAAVLARLGYTEEGIAEQFASGAVW